METIELIIPEHFLSALINGDESGLEDSDIAALDALTAEYTRGNRVFLATADTTPVGFVKYHDMHRYGIGAADCETVVFDNSQLED